MPSALIAGPGLVAAALAVLLWRRIISPTRFAQAIGALAIAVAVAVLWLAFASFGGGHG